MNYIKHKALTFCNQTKLSKKSLTFADLCLAANKIGYIVKPYSTSASMMIALGVYEEAMNAASVSVKDTISNVVIFINDKLGPDKHLFALAHEIGHIYLGHNSTVPKARQEEEANKFADYLLRDNTNRFSLDIPAIVLITVSLTLSLLLIIFPYRAQEKVVQTDSNKTESFPVFDETDVFYWTESGYVYHYYRNCQSLMHSEDILSGSLSEAVREKDRLCKFCEEKLR